MSKKEHYSNVGVTQFRHKGGEHAPGTAINEKYFFKEWNYKFSDKLKPNNHLRKYIRTPAKYINKGSQTEPTSGVVDFWGEWEPNSIAIPITSDITTDEGLIYPSYIHFPVYIENIKYDSDTQDSVLSVVYDVKNSDYKNRFKEDITIKEDPKDKSNLQNTDPFVFGDTFYYTCCKQFQTKRLKEGSVILFGTGYADRFVIDTVFVIKEIIKYNKNTLAHTLNTFRNSKKDSERLYYNTVLSKVFERHDGSIIYQEDNDKYKFNIIKGATYDNPVVVNGKEIYSFFPCKPASHSGFPRLDFESNTPAVDEFNKITDKNIEYKSAGTNATHLIDNDERKVYDFWRKLREYTLAQGYCLGVRAELPPILKPEDVPKYIKEHIEN